MKILCLFKHKWHYYTNIFGDIFRDCTRCGNQEVFKIAKLSFKEQERIAREAPVRPEESDR
jgi:hypothetical protein